MDNIVQDMCSACGAWVVPNAAFCHACGARIETRAGGTSGAREEAPEGGQEVPSGGAAGPAEPHGAPTEESAGAAPPDDAPSAEPSGAAASTDEGLARALNGRYAVRIGEWMSRGWDVFTRAGGLFLGFSAIVWLLITFAAPILIVLGPVMMAGLCTAALIVRRGGRLQFSDFWLPFNDFIPLFLAWLVSAGLMVLGLLTCGIATLYLWVGYQFVYLLVIDREMDFWNALEASRRAANKQWLGLFVFASLLFAINVGAYVLTFTLGLLVSLPVTTCALVEAYSDIFGVRGRIPGRTASVWNEAA